MNKVRIIIAQRGWVFVGYVERCQDGVLIRNAKVIRRWGTDMGLGQLASGPMPNTILDQGGTVRIHPLAIVADIECDDEAWEEVLCAP